jgi:hypothetical protein
MIEPPPPTMVPYVVSCWLFCYLIPFKSSHAFFCLLRRHSSFYKPIEYHSSCFNVLSCIGAPVSIYDCVRQYCKVV